ncbi:hypothetical protein LIER_38567 [Lithospermum erythrorhizon]|uniref:Retrotransposon Copia-like N-terminal domain-containing protein n=1 Tax=Lithospermum erythrorhizon TaxID=34254 RepID=A0AAV3Q477_LITER
MVDHDGKIEPTSPYFLGSGDQPDNLINHVLLQKDNYSSWSRAITIALKARRKFVFVDGTINKSIEARKLLNWEMVNSMLISWITCLILRKFNPYGTILGNASLWLMVRVSNTSGKKSRLVVKQRGCLWMIITTNSLVFVVNWHVSRRPTIAHVISTGHDNFSCFKFHGYPPWWEERRQGKSGCTSSAPAAPAGRGRGVEPIRGESVTDLKPDQVRVLMNMISNQQSDSMTGRLCLQGGLTLLRVFYVPQFTCNLISVAQLIDDSSCYVRFTNELCLIQDQHSVNRIGTGERKGGLYYYRRIPAVCAVTVSRFSQFEL